MSIAYLKKVLASNLRHFHKARCAYEIWNGKIEASQLSNCGSYWKVRKESTSKMITIIWEKYTKE